MKRQVEVECQGRQEHIPGMSGRPPATAYYPKAFVDKVVRAIMRDETVEAALPAELFQVQTAENKPGEVREK